MKTISLIFILATAGCANNTTEESKISGDRFYYASDMNDSNNGALMRLTFYSSGKFEGLEAQLIGGVIANFIQKCGEYVSNESQVSITYDDGASATLNDINNFFVFSTYANQSIPTSTADENAERINSLQITGYSPCP